MKDQFQIRNIFTPSPALQSSPPARSPSPSPSHPYSILHTPYSILHTPFRFLKWLFVGGPPKIRLTTDELENKRRRLALSVGVILLIILIVSSILGLYRRREIVRENQLRGVEERVEWIIAQAEQLSAISPGRAGELIREERLSVETELKQTKDKKLIFSLNQIISGLTEAERRVSRTETVAPELYLSLGLIRPDTSGRLLSAGQNWLGILSADGIVLLVSMSGRSGEVAAGGDLIKNAIDLAVSADKTFILNPDNIVEINSQNKTSAVAVADEDDVWQDPFRLSAFAGGLFVFDKSNSEIYKYLSIESGGYGSLRRWLAPGIAPDFSDVIDVAIDGDIWLLHQDGRLDRYRRGAPAGFKPSGLPDELVSPQAIAVPTDGSRVWILDNSSRIVAFDKDQGDYAGQWQFAPPQAGPADHPTDLAVSESSGKIFLLSGENIYVFDF